MNLKSIRLVNFRNHQNLELNLDFRVSYIFGRNGLGKTNILEAIYLISTTKSLRSVYDKDLILFGEKFLKVNAEISNLEGDLKSLEVIVQSTSEQHNTSSKTTKINQIAKSISIFAGNLKSVSFTPQDLDIILGSPSGRRKYIDSVLYQTSLSYKKNILEYTKALKQRNKLLEIINETGTSQNQLPFWNQKLIELGQEIQREREKFLIFINKNFSLSLSSHLRYPYHLQFNYLKSEINEDRFKYYEKAEIASKNTLVGPHKDDFEILLEREKLSEFGSRGQQRMGMMVLKQLELDFIFEETKIRPILLLDDIFSELDQKNSDSILELISKQQTIITSVEILPKIRLQEPNLIDLEKLLTN